MLNKEKSYISLLIISGVCHGIVLAGIALVDDQSRFDNAQEATPKVIQIQLLSSNKPANRIDAQQVAQVNQPKQIEPKVLPSEVKSGSTQARLLPQSIAKASSLEKNVKAEPVKKKPIKKKILTTSGNASNQLTKNGTADAADQLPNEETINSANVDQITSVAQSDAQNNPNIDSDAQQTSNMDGVPGQAVTPVSPPVASTLPNPAALPSNHTAALVFDFPALVDIRYRWENKTATFHISYQNNHYDSSLILGSEGDIHSSGRFDEHGISPLTYVMHHHGKPKMSAEFNPDKGLIKQRDNQFESIRSQLKDVDAGRELASPQDALSTLLYLSALLQNNKVQEGDVLAVPLAAASFKLRTIHILKLHDRVNELTGSFVKVKIEGFGILWLSREHHFLLAKAELEHFGQLIWEDPPIDPLQQN